MFSRARQEASSAVTFRARLRYRQRPGAQCPRHTRAGEGIRTMNRRNLLLSAGALAVCFSSPAWAVNPAEAFVSGNIQAGFDILNDPSASAAQRRDRFAAF